MYIIKNSIKNLTRYRIRYIMIGSIMLAIIFTTSISIIINTTTASIIDSYKEQFGAEVKIEPDYEAFRSNPNLVMDKMKAKDFLAFGESKLLHSKEYNSVMFVNANMKSVGEPTAEELEKIASEPGRNNFADPEGIVLPNVNIVSTTNNEISEDFKSGARKIKEGKIYSNLNDCLVSEAYAKLNNLKVGDKIKLNGVDSSLNLSNELTISGIYFDNTDKSNEASGNGMPAMLKRENEILTSFETVSKFEMLNEYGEVQPTFQLKDPNTLEAFKKELKSKGLSDQYKVTTDEASYNAIVKPVEGMADTTMTFVYVVLILGGIILAVIFSMSIRERKYEVGVLRAMGMKKGTLAFGIITEVFAVTLITLIIGLGSATLAAQPVSDLLLKDQVKTLEKAKNEMNSSPEEMMPIDLNPKKEQEPLSEMKVQLEAEAIVRIVIIAMLLALISSSISIFYITKYEPMKILSERD